MIGDPILLDGWTGDLQRSSFARVCVRIDLSQQLVPWMWLSGDLGRTYQPFEYEGLSKMCFSCGLVGHMAQHCRVSKQGLSLSLILTQLGLLPNATSMPYGEPVNVAAVWGDSRVLAAVHPNALGVGRNLDAGEGTSRMGASPSSVSPAHAPARAAGVPCGSATCIEDPHDVLLNTQGTGKPGDHIYGDSIYATQDSSVREGYGPWMIVQPRKRRLEGNIRRREAPSFYGSTNNRNAQRYLSADRRDCANDRRRSVSMKRGREPMRRVWAQKNSAEGQHANQNNSTIHLGRSINSKEDFQDDGG
ncbi:hypothetical protein HPP92_006770 [Vanilla planifolia]|uniref:CCHC-type domain-containing protein n=1 Tax=Vanilla planifolia TaxID=51239 RepID=A0A835V593_VANPL|nr:hypothetical protein HPP92_006770 [Vanilla planifolia]